MKRRSETFGYLLVIIGTILFIKKYDVIFIYMTDYYIFGSKKHVIITKKERENNDDYVYYGYYSVEDRKVQLQSVPTSKLVLINDEIEVMICPTLKKFLLGKEILIPYLISLVFLFFLLRVSYAASIRILENINVIQVNTNRY